MTYRHDCSECKFLLTVGHHHPVDVYFCKQNLTIPTLVARYGNEPVEYTSMSLHLIVGYMFGPEWEKKS
jgi:hypothetical protein